jgi:hypothetical protein
MKLGLPYSIINATQRKLASKQKPSPAIPEKRTTPEPEQLSFDLQPAGISDQEKEQEMYLEWERAMDQEGSDDHE